MSLKSIKKNYTRLLESISEAGVKITDSQKDVFDSFVTDIDSTLRQNRDAAIIATKKIVEERIQEEVKTVVESILKHQKENAEIAGKIQERISRENETKKLAKQVSSYLTEVIGEVLPKKTIVDYSRMQKLEKLHESMKELLQVSETDIDAKSSEMKDSLEKKNSELSEKMTSYEDKMRKMQDQISKYQAKDFVAQKAKDLPEEEQRKIVSKTDGMKIDQVKKNYDAILESVQKEIRQEQESCDTEKNLEEAIQDILDGKNSETASEEKEKTTSDKDVGGTELNQGSVDENDEADDGQETVQSVQVTESQMQNWIDTLYRITPNR